MKKVITLVSVGLLVACNSNNASNSDKDTGLVKMEANPAGNKSSIDSATAKADSMLNTASKELKMSADTGSASN